MSKETSMGGASTRFHSTLWSVVRDAREGAPAALQQLAAEYWKPAYFFIRRRGYDIESAKDLTQAYFEAFLEKEFLKDVTPERGKFRSFVMASLANFLSVQREKARAVKRGGNFNFVQAETDLVSTDPSPEKAFFKGWAMTLLERAIERLRAEVSPAEFALLSGGGADLYPAEKKVKLFRVRAKLRKHLRALILPSVDGNREVDSELRELLAVLK